jgi:hypothetical protein
VSAPAQPAGLVGARPWQRAIVLGAPLLAFVALALAWFAPRAAGWVIAADFWLLSFAHVASTFTRTVFRRDDRREHRSLLVSSALVAIAMTVSLVLAGGVRALTTVYFFWQTYHYARQSRGIHRALRRAAERPAGELLSDAVLYLTALWAIASRCADGPQTFFSYPLWVPPVPRTAAAIVAALAFVAIVAKVLSALREAVREPDAIERDLWHHGFLLGHVAVFVTGYALVRDPTIGWLGVNVWHNAQYLLFAYAFNHRRFAGPLAHERSTVASMSRNAALFYGVCVALGAAGYVSVLGLSRLGTSLIPWFPLYVVLVQTMNFQHYLADASLWRSPPRPAAT